MSLDETPAPLCETTKVTRLSSHVYSGRLAKSYCVASVPNGGYTASVVLRTAHTHMAERGQIDAVTAHWQYVNKTSVGPVILVVEDTKLGRGLTVLHITMYQDHLLDQSPWVTPQSTKAVTAYFTMGSLSSETGACLPTPWKLEYAVPPIDFSKVAADMDPHWEFRDYFELPHVKYLSKMFNYQVTYLKNIHQWYPRKNTQPGVIDAWVRLANGDRWAAPDLGYFVDIGAPLIVETYRPLGPKAPKFAEQMSYDTIFWYPTIVASLEVKKRLPDEGAEWLRYRAASKMIENGRYDVEVIVFDTHGDCIALSHHVAMAVGLERNQKPNKPKQGRL